MLSKIKYSLPALLLFLFPINSSAASELKDEVNNSNPDITKPDVINKLKRRCSAKNFDKCGNGVGPALTSGDNLKTSVRRHSNNTHARNKKNIPRPNQETGHSAGDGFSNWSVWGNYNNADFDSSVPLVNAQSSNGEAIPEASYSSDLRSFTMGTDTLIGSQLIAGLALGYEKNDTSTAYNGGNNESSGFTLSPYAAYLINDRFSVDVATGYSSLDYDIDRIDNVDGSTIRSNFDSKRWFVASNLNANFNYQNWFFSGRIGYMHMEENQDAYSEELAPTTRIIKERRVTLSQFITGVDVAYSINSFEPYATASYIRDNSRDEGEKAGGLPGNVDVIRNEDNDEVQYGLGLRYFGDNVSGTFEWSTTVGRDNFDSHAWMMTLRTSL